LVVRQLLPDSCLIFSCRKKFGVDRYRPLPIIDAIDTNMNETTKSVHPLKYRMCKAYAIA